MTADSNSSDLEAAEVHVVEAEDHVEVHAERQQQGRHVDAPNEIQQVQQRNSAQ